MNYSTITLFRNTKFYPNQNYKIDNIEEFLNSYLSADKKIFNNQQYWKLNGIIKEFKLDIPQAEIKTIHEFNYAKVEMFNDEGDVEFREWTLYYFIISFEWLSRKTIKLIMRIDTLNTFLDGLTFHPKTFIEREHTDRWDYNGYKKDVQNTSIVLLRNIPKLNEGLEPLEYNYKYDFNSDSLIKSIFTISSNKTINSKGMNILHKGNKNDADYVWCNMTIGKTIFFLQGTTESAFRPSDDQYIVSEGGEDLHVADNMSSVFLPLDDIKINQVIVIPYPPISYLINFGQWTTSNPLTKEKMNGIIKIYDLTLSTGKKGEAPGVIMSDLQLNIKLNRNVYPTISDYFEDKTTRFNELPKRFLTTKEINYSRLLEEIVDNEFFKSNNYSNESAMYSSEFLVFSFFYDSFNYQYSLEKLTYKGTLSDFEKLLDYNQEEYPFLEIKFIISISYDTAFSFEFITSNYFDYEYDEDISNNGVLYCSVNNKLPLFNDDYLNYLRNGFNYDVKIRDIGRAERKQNIAIKGIQTGATLGLGVATGGLGGALLGGKAIRGGIGILSGLSSDYYSTMKEDLEMEKNLAQLKAQKIGIDYTNGGLDKTIEINPSPKLSVSIKAPRKDWWKYLEDYFYYFGNKAQYYGIPSHDNRCLFDYLKCKAEFVNKNSIPTREALDDIITRLGLGVVFIHKFMNKWTFDSDYKENIERELYNIITEENKENN